MALQKVEFSFPDPDSLADGKDVKETENGGVEIVLEKSNNDKSQAEPPKKQAKSDSEVEIEIVDDRAEDDKNRREMRDKPMDITDQELESYSEKVRKRLQHFSKGYHEQRRTAEQAAKEREEALRYAQQIAEENKKLKDTVTKNQEILLEQAKKQADADLLVAKNKFKRAYDAGDSKELADAQEEVAKATLKVERVNDFKLPTLQSEENNVQTQITAPTPSVDPRAAEWQSQNKWFGEDDEMTSFALGLHQKLVKQGVNPRSDDYYDTINRRMRQVFPEAFTRAADEDDDRPRRTNIVAPATRSVAPKKITLTRTQVALAKRLGVPLEEYAKQVAIELRKQNG
jgi:hypothetical protein